MRAGPWVGSGLVRYAAGGRAAYLAGMLVFVLAVATVVLFWALRRVYIALWRLGTVMGALGTVLERVANRAALRNGEAPITTTDDEARISESIRAPF